MLGLSSLGDLADKVRIQFVNELADVLGLSSVSNLAYAVRLPCVYHHGLSLSGSQTESVGLSFISNPRLKWGCLPSANDWVTKGFNFHLILHYTYMPYIHHQQR